MVGGSKDYSIEVVFRGWLAHQCKVLLHCPKLCEESMDIGFLKTFLLLELLLKVNQNHVGFLLEIAHKCFPDLPSSGVPTDLHNSESGMVPAICCLTTASPCCQVFKSFQYAASSATSAGVKAVVM
jgi:hypothetical protein